MLDPTPAIPLTPPPAGFDVDATLAEMAAAGRQPTQLISGSVSKTPRPKMRYTHQAMVDTIIENPAISQNEIAAMFGRTPGWVSTIITSDAFQCLLAARKAELVDPELRLSLEERFRAITAQSLRVLQEKLARPADQVSDQLVLRAAELGAKSLGIGAHAPPPPPPNPAEYLPAIADRLMRLQGRPRAPEVVDAVVVGS